MRTMLLASFALSLALAGPTADAARPGTAKTTAVKGKSARKSKSKSAKQNRLSAGLVRLGLKTEFLRPGVLRMPWSQFSGKFGKSRSRATKLEHLKRLLHEFERLGVANVYVGGSFVSSKSAPQDVDLLISGKSKLDYELITVAAQAVQKYGINIFIAEDRVSDIGSRKLSRSQKRAWSKQAPTFLEFFQQNRQGKAVGVVKLALNETNLLTGQERINWASHQGKYSTGGIGSLPFKATKKERREFKETRDYYGGTFSGGTQPARKMTERERTAQRLSQL